MTWVIVAAVVIAVAALVVLVVRWRDPEKLPHRITPPAKRILFPFVGDRISKRALDAALRIARAESATLVPVYVARVPMQLNLEVPIPAECDAALPLLEAIEQRAARLHVPVDARIETGRSVRHAIRRLVDHEHFDRLVIPASESRDGFSADDIAWLLDNVDGEILVLRPAGGEHLAPRVTPGSAVTARVRSARDRAGRAAAASGARGA
jgi:nucleotide-binding universal stress UspA family protein